MSLLHKESYECVVSDLDLTAMPPTQTSVEDANIVEHNPIPFDPRWSNRIHKLGSASHYRDTSDMHLGLKCRVRNNMTEDIDEQRNVG